ncbi:ROK family protein [Chondrinema litorale]|uniref:ROK family protein n=1 Tax=Chondrinema litorale TaxID=2994555 RepID=UPI00254395EC|nr:ROK family protein [Chondrinema litorale]UZR95728.1 ROK family protein [Chondrinema litorale]
MINKDVTLGIDIGGTNTKLGLVNKQGFCLSELSIPTGADKPFDEFLKVVVDSVDKLKGNIDHQVNIKGVGIGAPNGNYYTGLIEEAPNLNWGDKVPVVKEIEARLGIPATLTNDANAAALGEMLFGVAQGMKNFVVITLGTGLGSGIVVNGELIYGHDGFAGELGHTTVFVDEGRDLPTGRKGSLEAYVSATGIKRTVFELLAKRIYPSELRDITYNQLEAKHITEAALRGDKIALEAFDYTAKILGLKLSDTIAHLSPEAIILFGGLANAGDLILEPTKKYMEQYCLNIFRGKVKLLFSNLKGSNTAILGSSALAWTEFERKSKA